VCACVCQRLRSIDRAHPSIRAPISQPTNYRLITNQPTNRASIPLIRYDWSKGDDPAMASRPNDIYIHATDASDLVVQPAAPKQSTHHNRRR